MEMSRASSAQPWDMLEPGDAPEDLLKFLEAYERHGNGGLGPVPDDLKELLKNVQREKGQPTEDDLQSEEVVPTPGFVVKTSDQDGRKVFINVCSSSKVPAPGGWDTSSSSSSGGSGVPQPVAAALERLGAGGDAPADAEALRLPLSCGEPRLDADRKGEVCTTIDCVLNPEILAAARRHRPFKAFLIELCIHYTGKKHGMELDARFKLPRMAYKGQEVVAQRMRVERRPLVTELGPAGDEGDEPSFPLLPAARASASSAGRKVVAGACGGVGDPSTQRPALPPDARAERDVSLGVGRALVQELPSSSDAASGAGVAGRRVAGARRAGRQKLQHSVEYEGRPVESVVIRVQLPNSSVGGGAAGAELRDVAADVCGQDVYVSVPGCDELHIPLPFAVSAADAKAHVQAASSGGTVSHRTSGAVKSQPQTRQQLVLQLPYLPLQEWVARASDEAPHAFEALPFAHDAYMELEP